MPTHSWPGPRRSVESLSDRIGRGAVVGACVDLLAGRDVDGQIIHALGGPPARWAVAGGESGPDYWLRVWALRGLLWVWDDVATAAVVAAVSDEAWRVREMAVKVVARQRLDVAVDALLSRCDDPVARVRATAERAVNAIVAGGAASNDG